MQRAAQIENALRWLCVGKIKTLAATRPLDEEDCWVREIARSGTEGQDEE